MINGILFLYKGKRVPFMAYRLLHNLLVEDGVFYYTKKEKQEFEAIIYAVGTCSKLQITYCTGEKVEDRITKLNYTRQVAICDIGAGEHSILINGFKTGIFDAFDPYWENVKDGASDIGKYETFPPYMDGSKNSVNLRLWAEHLFAPRAGSSFEMGATSKRFATVLTMP